MNRRGFLLTSLAGALAVPRAAEAQPTGKVARVGFLSPAKPTPAPTPNAEAFEQGLRERGWVEGQNIIIERRYAEGRAEQFPDLAADLIN